MNKIETTKILMILKTSYSYAFKDMNKEEIESMVNLYELMFKDDDYNIVSQAILNIIKTSEYLPTIATIKNEIFELNHKEKIDNNELWERLLSAIGRSNYYAEEEFEKLPDLVKAYVKSPRQLQELAQEDSDKIHTIEKSLFLREIEKIKQEYKAEEITGKTDRLLQEKNIYQLEQIEEN